MSQSPATQHDRTGAYRPNCPFCAAPWTDAMLDQLDALTLQPSCSCCVGLNWPLAAEPELDPEPPPAPMQDLCCAACGKAIYLAV